MFIIPLIFLAAAAMAVASASFPMLEEQFEKSVAALQAEQSQTGQAGSSVAGARAARALVNGFSWSLVWGSYEQRMVINGLLDV